MRFLSEMLLEQGIRVGKEEIHDTDDTAKNTDRTGGRGI